MDFSFNIEFAKRYGVDEAIMVKSFQFWIRLNKANKVNYHDKRYWTYNTNEALTEYYSFWSKKQVRRIIESLVDKEVLLKGNYNKIAYDRTIWYAFVNEVLYLSDNFHLEDILFDQKVNTILPNGQMEKTKQSNGFSQKGKPIPVANHVLNTITNQVISENEFSHTNEEIKNPFTRQVFSDSLDSDKVKKKEKLREKKEKAEPKQPSDIFVAYEMFCTFHESVSAAKYPRTLNGNYILNPIDARNVKLLLEWVEKIDPDSKIDNFKVFVQAAWMLDDKYLRANFNIGLLYRQCTQIYAKVQNSNPILSKQKKEEQLNAEAAEFLRSRYGIVN
jgi:uncharacterized protein (DUF1697 family)